MAAHHGHVTAASVAPDRAGPESASYARTLATKELARLPTEWKAALERIMSG